MKICALIVTYNRINDLKKCLNLYDKQKVSPDYVIVVNNNSNDGTKKFLSEWLNEKSKFNKKVINLEENTGGSGGFFEGLKSAISCDCDWIWLHDDDAFIYEDTIQKLKEKIDENAIKDDISAICGKVIDKDTIAFDHRRRLKKSFLKSKDKNIDISEYNKECFELNVFSYVGVAINKEKLLKVGITNKDFFIFLDDTEHSYRLSSVGKILCFPEIKIRHDNKYQENNHIANWKLYYSVRNNIYFHKYCFKNGWIFWTMYFFVMSIFKKIYRKDRIGSKLVYDAIIDGLNANMGKNEVYKPGWKVN